MTTSRPIRPGVLAVIRADEQATARTIVEGLGHTTVSGIEITLTVPGALDLLAEVSTGSVPVGIGTVVLERDCIRALELGAQFIVSPHFDPRLVAMCNEAGVFCIPGSLTPTEVRTAIAFGAPAVKLFPVGSVGGLAYVRALLEPFPGLPFVVSGGIAANEIWAYLDAGALAVCAGKAVIDVAAARRGDASAVAAHARDVLARVYAAPGDTSGNGGTDSP